MCVIKEMLTGLKVGFPAAPLGAKGRNEPVGCRSRADPFWGLAVSWAPCAEQALGSQLSTESWGLCLPSSPSSLRKAVGTVSTEPYLLSTGRALPGLRRRIPVHTRWCDEGLWNALENVAAGKCG